MKIRNAALPLLLATAGLSGCADNHASIEMLAICAPPEDAVACAMSSGNCEMYLASARPWVALAKNSSAGAVVNGLELWTEVHNQLPDNADETAGRVNTNDAVIEGYLLDFESEFYNRSDYLYPANFAVQANGTFVPVIKYIPELISAEMAAVLPPDDTTTVVVSVRLKGRLGSGAAFETGRYKVAVDVVNYVFPGYTCPAGQVLTGVCPNSGQTSSFTCEEP